MNSLFEINSKTNSTVVSEEIVRIQFRDPIDDSSMYAMSHQGAVVDASGAPLYSYIAEYNISVHKSNIADSPRFGTYNYILEEAVSQVPQEYRNGYLKLSFSPGNGAVETWILDSSTYSTDSSLWMRVPNNVVNNFIDGGAHFALSAERGKELYDMHTALNEDVSTFKSLITEDVSTRDSSIRGDMKMMDSSIRNDVSTFETSIRNDVSTLREESRRDSSALSERVKFLEERIVIMSDLEFEELQEKDSSTFYYIYQIEED